MLYKIRHKKTGLFLINAKSKYDSEYSILKLSETGKIFVNKPKLPDVPVECLFNKSLDIKTQFIQPCEWELVLYKLVEIGRED